MKFNWNLPQNWCHAGIPQANGLFGTLLVSGKGEKVKIALLEGEYQVRGEKTKGGKVYETMLTLNEELLISKN